MQDGTVNEVLLSDGAHIYEGLSSNFYTIQKCSVDSTHAACVYTAPTDLVLPGTIQKLVIQACSENNSPVKLHWKLPSLSERHLWSAAFITSTSRLVCPLANVTFPDPQLDELKLNSHLPSLTWLQDRVTSLVQEHAEPIKRA
jgi:branched-subunit amino acid aminotransferase/4-amino-4-deoxychorismate lyase